jgi:hypothetical protein
MPDAYVIIAANPGAPQLTILGENKQFLKSGGGVVDFKRGCSHSD